MAYHLEHAWLSYDNHRLLGEFSWSADDGKVTVVAGPVGTGKSTLLKLLSGRRPGTVRAGGTWLLDDKPLHPLWDLPETSSGIAWVPQVRNGPAGTLESSKLPGALCRIETALTCGARTVLLDEPTRGLPDAEVEALQADIRGSAQEGRAVVVVTHNVAFARAVADDICLFFDGGKDAQASASEFFERPPTPAASDFIERGTCAPPLPPPPPLPKHFQWFHHGQVGGMAKPGLLGDVDDELFALAAAGVSLMLSVHEDPLPHTLLRPYGITGLHVPCKDMGVPRLGDTLRACKTVMTALERGDKVAVHCRAGLGRTGTLVACILVHLGRSAPEAIAEVRGVSKRYIQSDAQLRYVAEIGECIA